MRFRISVISAVLLCCCTLAHADSFTFSLTPNTPGGEAGTGSLSVVGSVPNTPGTSNYFFYGASLPPMPDTLTQLTFSIGGFTFNAADDPGVSEVTFTGGTLSSVTFVGQLSTSSGPYTLLTRGLDYTFGEDVAGAPFTTGTLTNVAATVTPEPASFLLLGTGLLGVTTCVRRRRPSKV